MKKSNWRTTTIGVLLAALAVFQAAQKPSLKAAIKDPTIQLALAGAVLGKLAKDAANE